MASSFDVWGDAEVAGGKADGAQLGVEKRSRLT